VAISGFFLQSYRETKAGFPTIFGTDEDAGDEQGQDMDEYKIQFHKNYGSYILAQRLAQGKILDLEEIYKLNYIACLNHISYEITYNKIFNP